MSAGSRSHLVELLQNSEEHDYDVWTSKKRGRESEETGTESEMTDGTEETITDPQEAPAKRYTTRSSKKTESSERETTSSIYSVESGSAIRAEKVAARVSRAADKTLALLLPDKGPRSMEISTVSCLRTEFVMYRTLRRNI